MLLKYIQEQIDLQGTNHSFDEMVCVEQKFDINWAEDLCVAIKKYMVDAVLNKLRTARHRT